MASRAGHEPLRGNPEDTTMFFISPHGAGAPFRADSPRIEASCYADDLVLPGRWAHPDAVAENRERIADFRAHQRGRIEWIGTGRPHRHRKLMKLFAAIQW